MTGGVAACTGAPGIPQPRPDGGAPPGALELESVSIQVTRTRATRLQSADGVVTVVLPPLAVDTPVTLKIARLRDDVPPSPRLGAGYVVKVDGGTLRTPARVEWAVPMDVHVPSSQLRIARDVSGSMTPLPGSQAAADVVAALLDGMAVLVLVDKRTQPNGWAEELPATSAGDALLERADVTGARAAYHAARQAGPNPAAALGRAITDLLLMTARPPISDVQVRCGLTRDSLLQALVGRGGVLAQAAKDREGEASLSLTNRALDGTVQSVVSHQADEVYARTNGGRAVIRGRGGDFQLGLVLPAEPLPVGVRLVREQFRGGLWVDSLGDRFEWVEGAAGGLVLEQRGEGLGGRIKVRFDGVQLTGEPGLVTMDGTVDDVLTHPPDILSSLGVAPEPGPPVVPILSRLLEGCSPDLNMAWVVPAALLLEAELSSVAVDLSEAAGAERQGPLMTLPTGLTRLPRALPLTARDASLLGAAVELARAGLVGLSAYQIAGVDQNDHAHPFGDWVTTRTLHRWAADGGLEAVEARLLDLDQLSWELNEQLLQPTPAAASNLSDALRSARPRVESMLGHLRAAVAARGPDGLVQWSTLSESGLHRQIKELVEAMSTSMASGRPAAPASLVDTPYAVCLSRLFDDPISHEKLAQANGAEPLTVVFPGAPLGRTPDTRNARLLWHDRGVTGSLWMSLMDLPAASPPSVCSAPSDCAPGYQCTEDESGACSVSRAACLTGDGCPDGQACVRGSRCRRERPPVLDWEMMAKVFTGPTVPAMAPWTWHLVQPLLGWDAAR